MAEQKLLQTAEPALRGEPGSGAVTGDPGATRPLGNGRSAPCKVSAAGRREGQSLPADPVQGKSVSGSGGQFSGVKVPPWQGRHVLFCALTVRLPLQPPRAGFSRAFCSCSWCAPPWGLCSQRSRSEERACVARDILLPIF